MRERGGSQPNVLEESRDFDASVLGASVIFRSEDRHDRSFFELMEPRWWQFQEERGLDMESIRKQRAQKRLLSIMDKVRTVARTGMTKEELVEQLSTVDRFLANLEQQVPQYGRGGPKKIISDMRELLYTTNQLLHQKEGVFNTLQQLFREVIETSKEALDAGRQQLGQTYQYGPYAQQQQRKVRSAGERLISVFRTLVASTDGRDIGVQLASLVRLLFYHVGEASESAIRQTVQTGDVKLGGVEAQQQQQQPPSSSSTTPSWLRGRDQQQQAQQQQQQHVPSSQLRSEQGLFQRPDTVRTPTRTLTGDREREREREVSPQQQGLLQGIIGRGERSTSLASQESGELIGSSPSISTRGLHQQGAMDRGVGTQIPIRRGGDVAGIPGPSATSQQLQHQAGQLSQAQRDRERESQREVEHKDSLPQTVLQQQQGQQGQTQFNRERQEPADITSMARQGVQGVREAVSAITPQPMTAEQREREWRLRNEAEVRLNEVIETIRRIIAKASQNPDLKQALRDLQDIVRSSYEQISTAVRGVTERPGVQTHTSRATDLFETLFRQLAPPGSVDRIKNSFIRTSEAVKQDPAVQNFFHRLNQFVEECFYDPECANKRDFGYRVRSLWEEGQQAITQASQQLRDSFHDISNETSTFVNDISKDRVLREWAESIKSLTNDFFTQGYLGKYTLNTQALYDLAQVIMPTISETFSLIAVPPFRFVDQSNAVFIDELVLWTPELPPRGLEVHLEDFFALNLRDLRANKLHGQMSMSLRDLKVVAPRVKFMVNHKTFPPFKDAGHMDLFLKGIHCGLTVKHQNEPPYLFHPKAKCMIDDVHIKFLGDVKHSTMLNWTLGTAKNQLKRRIQNAIESTLEYYTMTAIDKINYNVEMLRYGSPVSESMPETYERRKAMRDREGDVVSTWFPGTEFEYRSDRERSGFTRLPPGMAPRMEYGGPPMTAMQQEQQARGGWGYEREQRGYGPSMYERAQEWMQGQQGPSQQQQQQQYWQPQQPQPHQQIWGYQQQPQPYPGYDRYGPPPPQIRGRSQSLGGQDYAAGQHWMSGNQPAPSMRGRVM